MISAVFDFDVMAAFNFLLERLDGLIAALNRLAEALEKD